MHGTNLPHGETTGAIIQAFHETYEELGSGFSEKVSRNALAIVLRSKGLKVGIEVPLQVSFRGQIIGEFSADMVVNETVLVEIKGTTGIEPYAEAQLLNYLKAAGGGVGLILNFGRAPKHKRLVMGDPLNSLPSLRNAIRGPAGQQANQGSPQPLERSPNKS
ncbi:MAG TPA: GxxExxY protein [Vicinamibacterales bacterium]